MPLILTRAPCLILVYFGTKRDICAHIYAHQAQPKKCFEQPLEKQGANSFATPRRDGDRVDVCCFVNLVFSDCFPANQTHPQSKQSSQSNYQQKSYHFEELDRLTTGITNPNQIGTNTYLVSPEKKIDKK